MPIIVILLLIIIVILAPGLLVIPIAAIGGILAAISVVVVFIAENLWVQVLLGIFAALFVAFIVWGTVLNVRENRKPGYHDAKRKRIEERRERNGSGDCND